MTSLLHLHWPLKAFNLSTYSLPPPSSHRPSTDIFSQQKFVSFLLRFTDITTPSLLSRLPLHYVIMIIAHRGLRKLNCLFCSGSFIPPVSLCATSPSPTILCRHGALLPGHLMEYILHVFLCVCVSLDHFLLKIEHQLANSPAPADSPTGCTEGSINTMAV